MTSIDDEWFQFLNGKEPYLNDINYDNTPSQVSSQNKIPECQDLYISTTTRVLFLNTPIDIDNVFWNINIGKYSNPNTVIIKKQMKIVSKTIEEYNEYRQKLSNIEYYTEHIIKQVNNPLARRVKFKDERKITIGISKKDIMNYRGKVKNAFYNCFAIIVRFKQEGSFKEIHVKVFNTGKLEIPGIINEELLYKVKNILIDLLARITNRSIYFIDTHKEQNVLINSNFNCGYYINRDKLYKILRTKYNLETTYDPCSYPGIKCKFYYNNKVSSDTEQHGLIESCDKYMKSSELTEYDKYTEISFMIFRTGSCLVVGNCVERILRFVYEYIKTILYNEYTEIYVTSDIKSIKEKKEKLRKKIIIIYNNDKK